jgi:putative ABC transport system permease protein
MALPLIYNLESVRVRWASTVVAVLGIAGSVGVFVAMLALARGFQAAMVSSGSERNAMVRRAGATSEMDSAITLEQLRAIEDSAEVMHGADGPLVSPEVVVVAALPLEKTGTDANVQLRGVSLKALAVHDKVKIVDGRFFTPGLFELVVGRNAKDAYRGVAVGDEVKLGGTVWKVVGSFDAGGSAFDSEIWCDANLLNSTYQRPTGIHQSVAARLAGDGAVGVGALERRFAADPRMKVRVETETDYYRRASQQLTAFITVLGSLVALVMALGAVFAALNTMYSAVAERSREIATIRALGFGEGSVVLSFVIEAMLVALAGGIVGCLAALPLNGLVTQTMNFQTFSHLSFAFRVTPAVVGWGIAFALLMGLVGGLPPAIRAARVPVVVALRDL